MLELSRSRSYRAPQIEGYANAIALCDARGTHLTTMRRSVLQRLWQSAQPLGAYDLLSHLEVETGKKIAPPTIYRALKFLQAEGLISRIESLNAYVACAHPETDHDCAFFVCSNCGLSEEIDVSALTPLIDRDAASIGFRVSKRMIEFSGTCARCLGDGTAYKTTTPDGLS